MTNLSNKNQYSGKNMPNLDSLFEKRFSGNKRAALHFSKLWNQYCTSNLHDSNFLDEISSDEPFKFEQRLWELVLGCYLQSLGMQIQSTDVGPDFVIDNEAQRICVEAIVPEPKGIPSDWLEKDRQFVVKSYPHEQVLLRWTAALKEKMEKLEGVDLPNGKRKRGYRETRIVKTNDSYVVAINGFCLGSPALGTGISQFPLAVEAAFPIGPIQVTLNSELEHVRTEQSIRWSIKNKNDADVPTGNFLDKNYNGISAILGCSRIFDPEGDLGLVLVHNPNSKNSIPLGLFGNVIEYVASDKGDSYLLEKISPKFE